jgi:hypothetical protein
VTNREPTRPRRGSPGANASDERDRCAKNQRAFLDVPDRGALTSAQLVRASELHDSSGPFRGGNTMAAKKKTKKSAAKKKTTKKGGKKR